MEPVATSSAAGDKPADTEACDGTVHAQICQSLPYVRMPKVPQWS